MSQSLQETPQEVAARLVLDQNPDLLDKLRAIYTNYTTPEAIEAAGIDSEHPYKIGFEQMKQTVKDALVGKVLPLAELGLTEEDYYAEVVYESLGLLNDVAPQAINAVEILEPPADQS